MFSDCNDLLTNPAINLIEKIKKWKKEGKAKSAIDEALLGLDRAKEMLLERRAYLESNIAAQREIAKVMFSSNNKPGKNKFNLMNSCWATDNYLYL